MLVGREEERARVERLVDDARRSRSGALLVRGEPGIGKTSLLQHAVMHAHGLTVLSASGVESESELAHAGLHQLLHPVMDRADVLPAPHVAALRAAFGLTTAEGVDRFRVALAVLGLLSIVAEDAGVLCVVDDAQWVDRASTDALLFVARRLEAEGVALLLAARTGDPRSFAAPALPDLRLEGLQHGDAERLLAAEARAPADAEVSRRIVAATGGNPLALIQVGRALTAEELSGHESLAEPLPVGRAITSSFLRRLSPLDRESRELALLIAVDDTGDHRIVDATARELGIGDRAWDALEGSELIEVRSGTVVLQHPLVRTAILENATFEDRRRMHLALADALAQEQEARRSLWHRAAAVRGADDRVADELEHAADDARLRGAHGAAASAFERAAALSSSPTTRARRLVAAAQARWDGGETAKVPALLEAAGPLVDDVADRAVVARLRGRLALEAGRPEEAYAHHVRGAALVARRDPAEALAQLALAAEVTWFLGRVELSDEVRTTGSELAAGGDERAGFLQDVLMGTSAVMHADYPGGAPYLRRALERARALPAPHATFAGFAASYAGEVLEAHLTWERVVTHLRSVGDLAELPFALVQLAASERMLGRFPSARVHAVESLRLARETGQDVSVAYCAGLLAQLDAVQGREEQCRAHARDAVRGGAGSLALHTAHASWALGRMELGLGRPSEAVTHLETTAPGSSLGHPLVALVSAPDLVEAAVRCGRPEAAADSYENFHAWEKANGGEWPRTMGERMRGLLADGPAVERHLMTSLDMARAHYPFDAARARLAVGERLRRTRRRAEARTHLRAAIATFEALGARPWAERARRELRATGEVAGEAGPSRLDELTPQELQIAHFVADGATNREIAAKLFLSVRTVEHHLRKAYAKLRVASRHDLARLVAESEADAEGPDRVDGEEHRRPADVRAS